MSIQKLYNFDSNIKEYIQIEEYMESNKINSLRIAVLTLTAAILFIIFSIFPALRVIVFFIGAEFIVISYLSKTPNYVFISVLIYAIIVVIFDGNQIAVIHITTLIIPSIILGYFLKNNKYKEIDYILPTMLTAIVMMYFFKRIVGDYVWDGIERYLKFRISGMADSALVFDEKNISDMIKTIKELMPALIIIFAMTYNIFSKYIATAILRIFNPENEEIPKFRQFYVPRELGLLFVITYVAVNVLSFTNLITDVVAQNVVLNIMYVLSFALAFQGLAVLSFFAMNLKFKVFKVIILLLSYIMFFFINPPLVIIALLDIFLDVRKLGFRRSK